MRPQPQLALLALCALTACHTTRQPVTRETVIGTYIYRSDDPDGRRTDHSSNRLALHADGKYDLIEGGPTKPIVETTGTWKIWFAADGPRVILDHAGYPVDVQGTDVRLLADNDVGTWYQRIK